MAEPRDLATMGDEAVVAEWTLGDTTAVDDGQDVLVLAASAHEGRGPEAARIPAAGLVVGRGAEGFPGGPLLDPRLSREHFAVRWRGAGLVVEDLGSRNGTRLDAGALREVRTLPPGSVLRAGGSLFVLARTDAAAAGGPTDPEIVGSSARMAAVRRAIVAVAPHDTTVLVQGETGTGKELVAAAVHRWSRRKGAFLGVNCAALGEGVLESELFGHKRGAFTGAVADKPGLFVAADGGTLFLDEVSEMPPPFQARLLRALEARAVRAVGASAERPVNVRIVAATNRDLPAEVRSGRFRADLYARLCQWPVSLPALRERREDVAELVHALLRRRGEGHRRVATSLLEALTLHPWPGNVRGLVHVVGAALIAGGDCAELRLGPEVRAMLEADLLLRVDGAAGAGKVGPADEASPAADVLPAGRGSAARATPEATEVQDALRLAAGSVAEAARLLGASRQQVYRVVEAEGWDLGAFRR